MKKLEMDRCIYGPKASQAYPLCEGKPLRSAACERAIELNRFQYDNRPRLCSDDYLFSPDPFEQAKRDKSIGSFNEYGGYAISLVNPMVMIADFLPREIKIAPVLDTIEIRNILFNLNPCAPSGADGNCANPVKIPSDKARWLEEAIRNGSQELYNIIANSTKPLVMTPGGFETIGKDKKE